MSRAFGYHCILSPQPAAVAFFLSLAVALTAHAGQTSFPADSGLVDVTQAPYHADNTGATDATAAIQQAIRDHVGQTRTLYFPQGVYLISDTLEWRDNQNTINRRLSLQGEDRDGTVLRLIDNAPGFNDPATPKAMIRTYGLPNTPSNTAFGNSFRNLTLDAGSGNPGAKALAWEVHNFGTVRDVTIRSGDGQGYAGLYTEGWPGPALVKNLLVEGFNYGIRTRSDKHSLTFENITLRDQHVAGFYNGTNACFIHNLVSENTVPAIETHRGFIVLVGATISGGVSGNAAIRYHNGELNELYLRDVTMNGYGAAIHDHNGNVVVAAGHVTEFATSTLKAFTAADTHLHLPIEDVEPFHDNDLNNWVSIAAFGAVPNDGQDDAAAIQAAIDAVSGTQTTVYFPKGLYDAHGTIHVRGNVKRIIGMDSQLRAGGALMDPTGESAPIMQVDDGAEPIVYLGRIDFQDNELNAVSLKHATTRTVACFSVNIRHYKNVPGAGKLFAEDIAAARWTVDHPQQIWLRQFNPEESAKPESGRIAKLVNHGADIWILGLKSEFPDTVVWNLDGGRTELLGGYIFCNSHLTDSPIFINEEGSEFSASYRVFAWDNLQRYALHLRDTRDGVTKEINRWEAATQIAVLAAHERGVPADQIPSVSLWTATPEPNEGDSVSFSVSASDPDGSVVQVELWSLPALPDPSVGPMYIGDGASVTWSDVPSGEHRVYARVVDNDGNVSVSPTLRLRVIPDVNEAGEALLEYWEVVDGQQVGSLTAHPRYPYQPNVWTCTSSLDIGGHRSQGIRVRGSLTVPTSCDYRFWIASTDYSAFRLSTTGSAADKALLAEVRGETAKNQFDKYPQQASHWVTLQAGQRYPFEILQKQDHIGSGFVQLAWESGSIPRQIVPMTHVYPHDPRQQDPDPLPDNYVVLRPTEDTYVNAGGAAARNFGDQNHLSVTVRENTYLRFDLRSLTSPVQQATLVLYPLTMTATNPLQFLEYVGNDAWSEDTLTYDSQPTRTWPFTPVVSWSPQPQTRVELDVTDAVNDELLSDGLLSLLVRDDGNAAGSAVQYGNGDAIDEHRVRLIVVTDGGGGPANLAPVPVDDAASTAQGTPVLVNVLTNDYDPDNGPSALFVQSVTQPQHGTASVSDSSIAYSPAPGFSGADTFHYLVSDGDLTAMARIDVQVSSSGGSGDGFEYPAFTSGDPTLALNGSAWLTSSQRLRLTDAGNQSGSAFRSDTQDVTAFSTSFRFQLSSAQADGFAFVIHNDTSATNSLGGGGSYLGYGGIDTSVAIKFDLYGGDANTVGLLAGGQMTPLSAAALPNDVVLTSGHVFAVQIIYSGGELSLQLTDESTDANATISFGAVDIPGLVLDDTAFVGFTGSTGGKWMIAEILDWRFVPGEPGPPPGGDNFTFTGFTTGDSQFAVNGAGWVTTDSRLRLTDAGGQRSSVFFVDPQDVSAFSTRFRFQLTNAQADGFTFMVQNSSAGTAALGGGGSHLGYGGITYSVAIKFDLYGGAEANTVGLLAGGSMSPIVSAAVPSGMSLTSGHVMSAEIVYDEGDLTLLLTDETSGGTATIAFGAVDIPTLVGGNTAYVGFSAATGGKFAVIDLLEWSY